MENLKQSKVGGIVAKNYKTAKVLTEHGIDFCCRGGITLEQACLSEGVAIEDVLPALMAAYGQESEEDFQTMSLSELVSHIVDVHHAYVNETGPVLLGYLRKIERVHGDRHPELREVRAEFEDALDNLSAHMEKEETILFPFIKRLEEAVESGQAIAEDVQRLEGPIQMMEHEHDVEGQRFRKISSVTNGYQPPRDACQTYRVSFQLLEEFENDLHRHIHLENNILFVKAKELFEKRAERVQ